MLSRPSVRSLLTAFVLVLGVSKSLQSVIYMDSNGQLVATNCTSSSELRNPCELDTQLNLLVPRLSSKDQETVNKTRTKLNYWIIRYKRESFINMMILNSDVFEGLKDKDVTVYTQLLGLFAFDARNSSDSGNVHDSSKEGQTSQDPDTICQFYSVLRKVSASLSVANKAIFDDIQCGVDMMTRTTVGKNPATLVEIFNSEFVDLLSKRTDDLMPLAQLYDIAMSSNVFKS